MKCNMILKLAASTMVITSALTGCGPVGGDSVSSASSTPISSKDAAKYADKAEKALDNGDIEDAISYAERSVAGVGNDPNTRALLGQTYLAAGRFHSAERSFLDAMDLGKRDARTILSLSLAQLAQGKAHKPRQLLENNRQFIPTADYGLALALAGDSTTAVTVLEQAIRNADVSARTRQNLGLAYALDGRWKEAKLMALQDMTPANVDGRIMQWAQMARPGAYEIRVASVLDVKPALNDPGQPVRLALHVTPASPAVAAATPAEDYSREVANFARDTPQPVVESVADIEEPKAAFLVENDDNIVANVAVPASTAFAKAPAVKPAVQKVAFAPQKPSSPNGEYLVQVGAFSSPENVRRAWAILSSKHKGLAAFDYASSTVSQNGKMLYRLSAVGLGSRESAKDLCLSIKAKGGACIVRKDPNVRPAQMVDKTPREFASR